MVCLSGVGGFECFLDESIVSQEWKAKGERDARRCRARGIAATTDAALAGDGPEITEGYTRTSPCPPSPFRRRGPSAGARRAARKKRGTKPNSTVVSQSVALRWS